MASSRDSTGPVPNESEEAQAAATELVGGSNTGIEEKQQRKTLAAAAGATPRVWPAEDVQADPREDLPTVVKPKDSITAESVSSPGDKALVRDAARSVVSVSAVAHGKID
ncbi:unnamed protein product [Urochloa humidicola]